MAKNEYSPDEELRALYNELGGNLSKMSRFLNINRSSLVKYLLRRGIHTETPKTTDPNAPVTDGKLFCIF
ncbi:hypothetical protein LZ24_03306 [Desulfobotulus alkaliphilus]|uniref:Regulatory Fis family protein n=1 Tax=Desulfobotulus alkaliphilus TaxID=622671 RepID=A0A562R243_9BACT|nr:hypothetical protein LZ24_03306 [Desulfobotulus alkaliphilus]